MTYRDADRDLYDQIALDVDREAQVEALADRLLEARGGGELVVLLRGGDAFERVSGVVGRGSAPWTWLPSAGFAMSSNRSSVPTRTSGADRLGAVPPIVFCPV